MRNCYKYRGGIGVFDKDGKSIFDRDVNTLANNQIYLPTKSELNDPPVTTNYSRCVKP